jgi:hypothetical protein
MLQETSFNMSQIDWEESANVGRITVKPLVDEELDEWKERLAGIDSLLVRLPSPCSRASLIPVVKSCSDSGRRHSS